MKVTLLVASVMLVVAAAPAAAQAPLVERSITVLGNGSTSTAPDLAIVRAGVTTQGKTARAASEANSKAMAEVFTALKAAGVAEKDIQTSHFTIHPTRDPRQSGSRITGFQANNQVSAKVRQVAAVPDVLDQLIDAGANHISGVDFTVSDSSKLLDSARAEAVADARRKAEVLAKAAGVRLGRATVIAEEGAEPPRPLVLRAARAESAPPIASGEETLRVTVSVTFELLH